MEVNLTSFHLEYLKAETNVYFLMTNPLEWTLKAQRVAVESQLFPAL